MARGWTVLVLLVVLALPTSAAAELSTSDSVVREAPLELLVLQRIDAVRASHGLAPFSESGGLTRAAVRHSRSMMADGFFAHTSRNGAPFWKRLKGFYPPLSDRWTVGENLAMFGGTTPAADEIVSAWMASSPHRANLLSKRFAQAGIAILYNPAAPGVYGGESTWLITLDVGTR